MYGVTIPDISAGSNQVGASDTCTPQVSCPAGLALLAALGIAIISASARTAHNIACVRRLPLASYLVTWKLADGHVGAIPTCEVSMAFPFAHAEKRRRTSLTPTARAALHALRTYSCCRKTGPRTPPRTLPRCSQGRVIALTVQGGRAVAPEVGTRR